MAADQSHTRDRVRQVIEKELEQVTSPAEAERIVQQAERLSAGETEYDRAEQAADSELAAARTVERTAARTPADQEVAATLVETATQAVASTPEASAVLEGALEAAGTRPAPGPAAPAARRGRDLLKAAVLRRMGPAQAFDARLYLFVNTLPHAVWLDRLANGVTFITTGGWIWSFVALPAARRGWRRQRIVREVLPSVAIATWIVEHPIKAYFRRQRPFIEIVRALVIGKKPGSWSFPSGHTAASFAAALMLSSVWPHHRPWFFALASLVGFSRVYVGAHYPGDVLSGATLGSLFSALARATGRRLFSL